MMPLSYVTGLPKTEQRQPTEWQARYGHAAVGRRHDGPTMMAHIAMMRALRLNRSKPKPMPRKKRAKAHRIIR